jgi:hypothetical protein
VQGPIKAYPLLIHSFIHSFIQAGGKMVLAEIISSTLKMEMLLRNIGCNSTDYMASYPQKMILFITTGVKTSNPTNNIGFLTYPRNTLYPQKLALLRQEAAVARSA